MLEVLGRRRRPRRVSILGPNPKRFNIHVATLGG